PVHRAEHVLDVLRVLGEEIGPGIPVLADGARAPVADERLLELGGGEVRHATLLSVASRFVALRSPRKPEWSMPESSMRSAVMLIDSSSLLYRAFHSLPASLPMQGVYGFLNMLARLITDHGPSELAIAVDDDWRPAFRVDALPSYKTHRVATEDDADD